MQVPCQTGAPARRTRPRRIAALALVAASSSGATFWLCDGKSAFDAWMLRAGHQAIEKRTSTVRAFAQLPRRWLHDAPAPRLDVEIAFKNVQVLRAGRQAALRRGYLDASSKQEVAAHVLAGDVRSRAKVRLKGDLVDHIESKKVSLRVQVDGDPPVLGLYAFSLQSPSTKGFHLESLFHASVRHFGVLSPRYEFVRARYNGDDIGVMALEEHCAKGLLEHQGRRESVIVRFVEDAMFAAQARLGSHDPNVVAHNDYRTAAVCPVGADGVYPQQETALSLLRAFVAGTLPASQVFAVEDLASYLAVCELWGTWHAIRWHNLRFHFDPLTGRLAPVGFDGNLQLRHKVGHVVSVEEPMVTRMLEDTEVMAAFRRRLRDVCAEVESGKLLEMLAEVERRTLPILQSEYWLLQALPMEELRARAAHLRALPDSAFVRRGGDPGTVPLLVSEVAPGSYELRNVTAQDVVVRALRWVRPDGGALPAELPASWRPALRLPAKPETGPIPDVELQLAPPATGLALEVEAGIASGDAFHFARAVPQPRAARVTPMPTPALASVLAENPWLRLDEEAHTLRVVPGRHRVSKTVILPRGHRLVAEAATELRFAADAALVVQGGTLFTGNPSAPVILAADTDAGWLGIAVLAADTKAPSHWQHVRVQDTLGVRAGVLEYTGAVLFDQGDVTLEDVLLSGTRAEDALNIIRATIALRRVRIERTTSDAFDGDFVRGTVADCSFADIGGDAIDVSGADVKVERCRMRGVRDKALSVGEGSRATAVDVLAERAGVGAACKDGSVLTLGDSRIVDAEHAGVMAYVKKPDYGACRVTLTRVACEGSAPAVRVQEGSSMVRDGTRVPAEAIDVDALYSTIMRKR